MRTGRRLSDEERKRIKQQRTPEQVIAGVNAGHTMADMPLTDADAAAVKRMLTGETTFAEERDRIYAEVNGLPVKRRKE